MNDFFSERLFLKVHGLVVLTFNRFPFVYHSAAGWPERMNTLLILLLPLEEGGILGPLAWPGWLQAEHQAENA